jgi:hypothetical protein
MAPCAFSVYISNGFTPARHTLSLLVKPTMSRFSVAVLLASLPLSGCGDLLLESERVPSSIRLESKVATVVEGSPVPLTATVLDQHGNPFERVPGWAGPVWSSANSSLVGVQEGGLMALQPGATSATVRVGGLSATATVRVNPRALAVEVAGVYLTQSIQAMNGSVPLIQGRDALVRVFLRGDQVNFFSPRVRVQLYQGGTLARTLDLEPGGDSIPTALREGSLHASWNAVVPASLVQPGLSVVVEADPGEVVPRKPGSRTRYPAAGALAPEVRSVPKLWLRLVPIRQAAHGTTGNVGAANRAEWIRELVAMFPIAEHDVDVRSVYSTDASASTSQGWRTILSELWALRAADGSRRYYYGILSAPGGSNIAGLGYVGYPASIGYDALPNAAGTLAHELGHNFGRLHAPCGNPASVDPGFPHAGASIGAFGYDPSTGLVKDPGTDRDLMSYCRPRWVSDYTFRAVLDFRTRGDAGTGADVVGEVEEPTLLLWGRISGGSAVLEPAFELTTRPVLPSSPGPFAVEGLDATGTVLFSVPFQGAVVADHDGSGERQFAFAVPTRLARTDRLARLRLTGPGVHVERGPAAPAAHPAPPAASLRREARTGLRLEWTEGHLPMALVRDAGTGEVLSFARGGEAVLDTRARELEVLFSDGIRTTRRTLRVQ